MMSGIGSALLLEMLQDAISQCSFLAEQIKARRPIPAELRSHAIRNLEHLAALLSVNDL